MPQKPYLFSGTVASNLRYGKPDATDDELWHALEVAQARPTSSRRCRSSSRHRSRRAARTSPAVSASGWRSPACSWREPEIYLFDDSFSALDYATDAALREALSHETADATVVIVAQRVSTIRDADRIVVLDEGRVVGTGTHNDLMSTNETYREIVLSQLTEAEATA